VRWRIIEAKFVHPRTGARHIAASSRVSNSTTKFRRRGGCGVFSWWEIEERIVSFRFRVNDNGWSDNIVRSEES
jgi:hypothetical protein